MGAAGSRGDGFLPRWLRTHLGRRLVGTRGAGRLGAGAFGKIGGTDRRLALEIELVERDLDRARRRWGRRRSGAEPEALEQGCRGPGSSGRGVKLPARL